jgi:hypothetical protein
LTPDGPRVKVMHKNRAARAGHERCRCPEMTMNEPESQPASAPALSGDSLVLSDVYLLTAESGGNTAVPGLTLVLDGSGLTVRRPDGAIGAVVAWTDALGLTASERMRTPAGSPGVIVQAVTASRTHRFLVPSDNPAGLEYEVTQLAETVTTENSSPPSGSRSRSGVLTGALVVFALAIIALGVLVATGTVKF